jgi:hypothetical protein
MNLLTKLLIELLPLGAMIGRAQEACYNSRRYINCVLGSIFIRSIFEGIIIFPTLYLSMFGFHITLPLLMTYTIAYIISWLLMNVIYDMFYALNDSIFVRYEDRPTLRRYIEDINLVVLIIARLIYMVTISILLVVVAKIPYINVLIAILLLLITLFIHNSIRIKLWRVYSIGALRFVRLFFIPLVLSPSSNLFYILAIAIPYVTDEIIKAYNYELGKCGIQLRNARAPILLFSYLVYLPFLIILFHSNYVLLIYLIILVGSLAIFYSIMLVRKRLR